MVWKGESKRHREAALKRRAMRHKDIYGAGARVREGLTAKQKFDVVLAEFHRGTLWSGKGKNKYKVKNPRQAYAIAYDEARQVDPHFRR